MFYFGREALRFNMEFFLVEAFPLHSELVLRKRFCFVLEITISLQSYLTEEAFPR